MVNSGRHPELDQGDCPFCAIVHGLDQSARIVYRDDTVVAFLPTDPATLGHTLVVPRKHIPDIWALDESTARAIGVASLSIADAIRNALHPEGLNVIQSNGEAATQTVPHLHVHLVPRWSNDTVGPIWPESTSFSEQDKQRTLDSLVGALKSGSSKDEDGDKQDSSGSHGPIEAKH